MKRRVLHAIAADATPRHLTVQADEDTWFAIGPGLRMKRLHAEAGVASHLVRLAPGASLPAHRHPVAEECVVLEGAERIGRLRVAAGGFHPGPPDLPHDRVTSDEGALMFLRGAPPTAGLVR